MAIGIEGVRTWAHLATEYNVKTADAATLSDGRIVFAFGGTSATLEGFVTSGVLNQTSDTLGSLSTRAFLQASGGYGFTAVNRIDLEAGPGGRLSGLVQMLESSVGDDANPALLVQRFSGSAFLGAPVAVNPATPTDATARESALVYDATGGYAAFFTESVTGGGQSNGIRMARFGANGAAIGGPVTVVDDAAGVDPLMVDATRMSNGNIALVWNQNSAFTAPTYGQPEVMLKIIRPNGAAVGNVITLDGTSAVQAQITTLKGGGMVAVWLDYAPGQQGIYRAQMLSATGAKVDGAFEISSTLSEQEVDLRLIALENGGFAVSWRDMSDQAFLARMFNPSGQATGNDFEILDTMRDFIGGAAGLIAKGSQLVTYMHGLNPDVGGGFVLQGQTFSTAASWGSRTAGTAAANTLTGGLRDDVFAGRGGNDSLTGGGGNDILRGETGGDTLSGGAGRDMLTGGIGADKLTGGGGEDVFIYASASEGGDRILDFDGSQDRLILTSAGFGGAYGVASGASTNAAHQGVFFNTSSGVLSYDSDGSGASARVTIATLSGVTALAYDDVLFI